MKHLAKKTKIGGWQSECGSYCWVPDDLTDKKAKVVCGRCKRTKAFTS